MISQILLDILIDGVGDYSELDNYLSQPLENVYDLILWW
jgi:hypothetical protein